MQVGFKVAQKFFFDSVLVERKIPPAVKRVLSKYGAYVRRNAKGIIRPSRNISKPGRPPNSHNGLLRDNIYFSYDPDRNSVVIGPVELNQKQQDAPRLLEIGGKAKRTIKGKVVLADYRPRPFMGPANEKEIPKLPAMWADSIR